MVLCSRIDSGELTEKQDYPVDEGARLLDRHSTPQLVPSDQTIKGHKHVNKLILFKVIRIVLFKGTYYSIVINFWSIIYIL